MPHDDDRKPTQVGTDKTTQPPRQEWLQENRRAIDHYTKRVAEHVVFSDGLRSF